MEIKAANPIMLYWSHLKSKQRLREEIKALFREEIGSLRKKMPKL